MTKHLQSGSCAVSRPLMVLADSRWLLLWFGTISAVTGGASSGWAQGSVVTPALLANRNQDKSSDDLNSGTCGYGRLRYQWPLAGGVAFPASNLALQSLPMSGCGSCWEIQCISSQDLCTAALSGTSITLSMVGWCHQCQQHDLLLDPSLHVLLAGAPPPQVKYRQVECMAPGNIQVVVTNYTMDNSSISLHFVGLGGTGSLQAVQIGHSDGRAANSWLSMQSTAGASWTAELMFFGCAPFDLRLTDTLGQTVVLREVIPFQGFVGSAQTGVQFIARSSNTAHLLPPSTAPSVDFNETAAPRLPDKMLPPGVSSTVLQPAPIKDEQAQPGSTTIGTVSPEQQLVPNASPLDNGSVSQAGDRAFEAASPEASEGSQGKKGHTAGTGAGGRSPDSNSTTAEGVGSTLSRDYDLQTHSPSPSVNIPKPASSAGLSGPHHNTSPESPNPSPPPNSPSSSPPGALFSAPATSPAAHNAKPAVMFVNTSSPAGPLLGSEPQPKPLYDPSASSPAVHALAPSDLKAPAPQAASGNSTADVQSNSSHSSPSNAMRTNFQQHPNQSDTLLPPALSPLRKENIDRPVLTPAPATVIRAGPPGLLPAAPMPQAGATGQREAAPGPNPPAPEQNLPASQQMPANSSESAQGMSPNSAGTPHPWPGDAPAPDNVPAPGPALSRAAAAPGDSQTVYEKTHTNNLAVIVLGALLGVAIAALLAAMCLLLGLGAFRQRRRPALVSEETNTEPQADRHLFANNTPTQADPLFCLQDEFGGASWKHDSAYHGADHWRSWNDQTRTVNVPAVVGGIDNGGNYSGMRHTQALMADRQSVGRMSHPVEARAPRSAAANTHAEQHATRECAHQQVGQEGLAVLGVQRLDISPAGLLKLKLLQKAGNLLLQSLEVRQSSQGQVQRGWSTLSRANAFTWHMESFLLKPPFDLRVTGSLGEKITLRRALTLSQTSDVVIRMKAARGGLQERDDLLSQQPLAAGPYFFSMKSPDPSDQEIVPVPSRMTPAPHAEALSQPRTNVLASWPSSLSFDGCDSQHGGLSSTYSSLEQYAMEGFPSSSPAFIPTPACMDVRASKAVSRIVVREGETKPIPHQLKFGENQATCKKLPRRRPTLNVSELVQHYPPIANFHTSSESACDTESVFSESASTLELHTVPHHFGAKNFGKVNSLFRGAQQRQAAWGGEQLVGSCIPGSRVSSGGPRGQYANWARPPDALMGTAFSFQSELLESYAPSLHSGAYSAAATGARTRQPDLAESDAADRLLNEAGSGIASDLESTDWPFDGMSCHTPVALQHREIERPAVSSTADMDAKRYSELVGDSAWETLRHEKHMERYSDSSGSTMTYDTSFIKHVGDRLFDTLAK